MDEAKRRLVEDEMEALLQGQLRPRPPPPREVNAKNGGGAVEVEKLKVEEEKIYVKRVERVHTHNPPCPKCGSA